MWAAITLILALIAAVKMVKLGQRMQEQKPEECEEEPDEFDLATVSEKIEIAHETNNALNDIEQLITDLDTCNTDRQAVVEIKWVGEDDREHTHDLYCDGMNTATECLRMIAEREAHSLRKLLAHQCQTLAGATRRGKINGNNDRKTRGEWSE